MGAARGAARVDRDADRAIRRVLEAGRHGERGRKLAVHLRLGRARADRTPGDEVGGVLRGDGVEELAARGETHIRDIEQERARQAQALVDLEAAVHLGVVDEALPPDGRARLLEVDAHDDMQVLFCALRVGTEQAGIFASGLDVVDRAWPGKGSKAAVLVIGNHSPNDDQQAIIPRMKDVFRMFAAPQDSFRRRQGAANSSESARRKISMTHRGRSSCRIAGGMRGRVAFTRRSSS